MKKKFKEQRTFPDGVSYTLHGAQFWVAQEQFVASLCFQLSSARMTALTHRNQHKIHYVNPKLYQRSVQHDVLEHATS